MASREPERRRRQSERDRAAAQDRRDRHQHDEARLQPCVVAGRVKASHDDVGIGHNRGPPLDTAPRDPDRPVWGAKAIVLAAGLVDKRGRPRTRAAFHLLKKKLLPADKIGKSYVSTPRRLRSVANGGAT
jgi:hypothetical protein